MKKNYYIDRHSACIYNKNISFPGDPEEGDATMSPVANPILQQYMVLTEFLGQALGPSYEVVLHDLTDRNRSIVAIANSHISGREVGAPLTNMALSILRDRSYELSDYTVNDYGLSINGRELRSNTMYIKQDGQLIGMLCINFDDSAFQTVARDLMELIHPGEYLEERRRRQLARGESAIPGRTEQFSSSSRSVAADAVGRELRRLGKTTQDLSAEDRLQIITVLEREGVFLLKGVIREVAGALGCSQASVYRYLTQVKNSNDA